VCRHWCPTDSRSCFRLLGMFMLSNHLISSPPLPTG
jgi:hypothetical protein